ncbi:MAG: Asp-tRNA(Asn)/Glu-tRNA(Gln) amidotransferase subunit GatC [Phycisphaerales bacterium]|jgi:aspartyl-tRNA(Asn)/glutamyl-tRNA(Gln) amidotransferase subunit C
MSSDAPPPAQTTIDVRKVARLARLDVADADVPALTRELASILGHARGLDALDLDGVEPLSHPSDLDAPLAEDVAGGELSRDALEHIAPSMDGSFIEVPKVLGGQGGA